MHEVYEYRTIRVAPRSWAQVKAGLEGAGARRVGERGGTYFGAWRGQIGLGANEGIVLTAWPDQACAADARGLVVEGVEPIVESSSETLVATVRPVDPTPPALPGVYAHRTFEIDEADWPEFLALSEGAWPSFERTNDANIIGFFRSCEVEPPRARVLLLTRYASLAAWESSRGHRPDTRTEPEAFTRFARRHRLTHATRVITTEPL